ncbi:MAG: glycosyltransferase [Butyrivibrio sp.]|nr:glycosyltransferase [Butyrivibrio sp.]
MKDVTSKYPNVDVVIPVYKPKEEFLCLLQRLLKQTDPVNRIIIINTEKVFFDERKYMIAPNIEVYHISREEFDHAATRNAGLEKSSADYVLFMTMDAIPKDKRLIESLLEGFEGQNTAVAYARQLPKADCRLMERYSRAYNYPDRDMYKTADDLDRLGIKTFFCSDVCAMYDRRIYKELGGFTERAVFNEDMVYAAKAVDAGYGIMYCARAQVYHSHNYGCLEQFKRNFDLGVSQAEHPEVFERVSSESEGVRLVKETAAYLCRRGHWYELPYLVLNSAYKYMGYRKGKKFRQLSPNKILKYTNNRYYWKM